MHPKLKELEEAARAMMETEKLVRPRIGDTTLALAIQSNRDEFSKRANPDTVLKLVEVIELAVKVLEEVEKTSHPFRRNSMPHEINYQECVEARASIDDTLSRINEQ